MAKDVILAADLGGDLLTADELAAIPDFSGIRKIKNDGSLTVRIGLDGRRLAHVRHLQDNRNLNYVPYGAAFLPQNQDPTLNPNARLGSSALATQFLRPLRGIGNINLYESAATGNYKALQVSLNRRAGRLFLGVAYTWSKDLTTAPVDTSFVRPDQFTRQAYYGPSANDRRHNFADCA